MAPLCSAAALPAVLLAACLLSAAGAGAAAASRPPASSELAVLQSIRAGLDPASTVLSSWQPTRSCSTWRGLTCDSYGHVTSINFGPSVTFTGALVSAIGSLPYLATLVVRSDGFVAGSTIPSSISKLSRLRTLVLSGFDRTAVLNVDFDTMLEIGAGAGLSGSLPAGIAALSSLTYLDLSNNILGGALPSFARARRLAHLDLSGNTFNNGPLFSAGFQGPASTFSASNALTFLNLASNNFSTAGTLSVLKKLKYLNLGANSLNSFVGADIRSPSLTYLNVSANVLQGALPDLAHMKSLQSLDLSNNLFLTGTLRADYSALTSLRLLNLSQVSAFGAVALQGPIPAAYGALSNLTVLSISCPNFEGSVGAGFPPSLGKLHNLQSLTISGAGLLPPPGLPAFVGNLTGLRELTAHDFAGSEATGAFPSNLADLQSLTSLTLGNAFAYGRVFSGGLPRFVLSLKSLQELDLSSNNFSGPVWPGLRALANLSYIDLSTNSLSGTLADVLGAGPRWRHVALSESGLEGPVPAAIGSLKSLQYLSLGLFLNGALPASVSQLTALRFLSIRANNFSGVVPDLSATKLEYFLLAENNFAGALPKLPGTLRVLSVGNNDFAAIPDVFTGLNQLIFVDLTSAGPAVPTLPASLFRLPRLQTLWAPTCGLKSIPADITGAVALNYLDLSNNQIAQPFPAGVQSLRSLTNLNLGNNLFMGPVPDLSSVPLLGLNLYNNSLSGPLPRLGRLGDSSAVPAGTGLTIDFSLNNFTGGVASGYLADIVRLSLFDVSHNQLTGPLPAIPTTFITTPALIFSFNAFSGTLPPAFFDVANLSLVDVSFNQLSGPLPDVFDVGTTYPGVLDNNYFTGRPVFVNASTGISSCIASDTSYNCLTFNSTDCPATPQRPAAQCAAFCGDTSASGPCAGRGVCSLRGAVPTCACDAGYTAPPDDGATCARVPGHHPPGQGHHPPGQGHHTPPPTARRLMQ